MVGDKTQIENVSIISFYWIVRTAKSKLVEENIFIYLFYIYNIHIRPPFLIFQLRSSTSYYICFELANLLLISLYFCFVFLTSFLLCSCFFPFLFFLIVLHSPVQLHNYFPSTLFLLFNLKSMSISILIIR